MSRSTLVLVISLMAVPMALHGQSVARANGTLNPTSEVLANDDRLLAARAIIAMKRLENDVIVYRSLSDFEESGKLARVSFQTFQNDLREVAAEVTAILPRLPQGRLKTALSNALDAYHDGAFWWRKIYQPRVVHISDLNYNETSRTPLDLAFQATVPYTVTIHWRQGAKYVRRAEELQKSPQKVSDRFGTLIDATNKRPSWPWRSA